MVFFMDSSNLQSTLRMLLYKEGIHIYTLRLLYYRFDEHGGRIFLKI
jgi:hypothetical protein